MLGAGRVGAVAQLAQQLHRTRAREEAALAVAADGPHVFALPAGAIVNLQGQFAENRVGGPVVRHRRDLPARGSTPR
jgi:hypothetical protein